MKLEILNVDDWPIAQEEVGQFEKYYIQSELNYILEGAGSVSAGNETVHFEVGDLVTVMPETTCTWNITKAIRRHYSNG